jgi:hypothetical protein
MRGFFLATVVLASIAVIAISCYSMAYTMGKVEGVLSCSVR